MSEVIEADGLQWKRVTLTKERLEQKFYVSPEAREKKLEALMKRHVKPIEVKTLKVSKEKLAEMTVRLSDDAVKHKVARLQTIKAKDEKALQAMRKVTKVSSEQYLAIAHRLSIDSVRQHESKLETLRKKVMKEAYSGKNRKATPRVLSETETAELAQRLCPPPEVVQRARSTLVNKVRSRSQSRPATARGATLTPDEMDALAARLASSITPAERTAAAVDASIRAMDALKGEADASRAKSKKSLAALRRSQGAL